MPNLFLGFPVPRAKIAEMIAGAAPPLAHAAWHKPSGTDALVLPADISIGQAVGWNGTKYLGVAAGGGGGAPTFRGDPAYADWSTAALILDNSPREIDASAIVAVGATWIILNIRYYNAYANAQFSVSKTGLTEWQNMGILRVPANNTTTAGQFWCPLDANHKFAYIGDGGSVWIYVMGWL